MTINEEPQTPSNSLDKWIAWLQSSTTRVDLVSALAAGFGLSLMGLVLLNISVLRRTNPMDFFDAARIVLRVTIPYLIAGLIIHWTWTKSLRRVLPGWLMIACLGSWLLVVSTGAWSFYTDAVASNTPANMLQTLPDYIRDRMKDALAGFVVLSLLTLPVTATVYYADSIVRAVRLWHTGPKPLSILSTNDPSERSL